MRRWKGANPASRAKDVIRRARSLLILAFAVGLVPVVVGIVLYLNAPEVTAKFYDGALYSRGMEGPIRDKRLANTFLYAGGGLWIASILVFWIVRFHEKAKLAPSNPEADPRIL
jgi:hypothetical protein